MNNMEPLHREPLLVDWEKLLENSVTNTIFQTAKFQRIWLDSFFENIEPIIVSEKSGGKLQGLALFQSRDNELTFVGGNDVSDYLDFIVSVEGDLEKTYENLWEKITKLSWRKLTLTCIPEKSPTISIIPRLALSSGCRVEKELKNYCPEIKLPDTWEKYLGTMERKKRHELLRKKRRLEGAGKIAFRRTGNKKELETDFAEFLRLHKLSSIEKAKFMDEKMESFFNRLASEFISDGKLALEFTSLDEVNIASSFSFEYEGILYYYNSGFDPKYRDLSPGINHTVKVIDNAIIKKVKVLDFLQGNEQYKYALGAENKEVYNIHVERDETRF